MIVSPLSRSRSIRSVGSPSTSLASDGPSLSTSALVRGSTAAEKIGAGISGAGTSTSAPGARSVWNVVVDPSFVTTPMSPATSFGAASSSLPATCDRFASRSSDPSCAFWRCESASISPLITRRYDSLPTNSSAMVLKMNATAAPSPSQAAPTSGASAGCGSSSAIRRSSGNAPMPRAAETGTTGANAPLSSAGFSAARSSSAEISSSSR